MNKVHFLIANWLIALVFFFLAVGTAHAYPPDSPEVDPVKSRCLASLAASAEKLEGFDILDRRGEYVYVDRLTNCLTTTNTGFILVTGPSPARLRYEAFKDAQADAMSK